MRNPRGTTRVALVEDHLLFAESLEIALGMEGYQVRRVPLPDRPSSLGAVLAAVLRAQPRIVLLDLDLGPHGNGVRLIEPLTKAGIAVVVVTGSMERTRWGECLRYGARTVLTKTAPLNDILATVRRLNDGFPVMDRVAREELIAEWHQNRVENHEARRRLEDLTPREREVLRQLMQGHQVREIARLNVVSEATVRTQVKSILAKLEVSSQLAAVGLAHEAGWRPSDV